MSNYWQYKSGQIVDELQDNIVGFVYLILNKTKNKKYIGKKQKVNIMKKPGLKGSKRKRVFRQERWKEYTGSNIQLNNDIKDGDQIVKIIIHLCTSKKQMTYLQQKEQFIRGVLQTDQYYNQNIAGKIFRKDIK